MSSYVFIAELIGTFILTFSIEFITAFNLTSVMFIQFVILAGFFVAITLTREISGGHINPAVTLTVYLSESDDRKRQQRGSQVWFYWLAQILGALLAAIFGMWMLGGYVLNLQPSPTVSTFDAFVMEAIGSGLFYYLILVQGDAFAGLVKDKTVSTFVVTMGLAAGIAMAGNLSGAGLNPAIGIAMNLTRFMSTGDTHDLAYLWLYIIAPLVGSVLAALFYYVTYRDYPGFSGNRVNIDRDLKEKLLKTNDREI